MKIEDPADVFARLAVELHDAAMAGVEDTAQTLVQFAVPAVGCRSAGVALGRLGMLEVAAVSDPQLKAIYEFQFGTGDGPLVTAFAYDTVVRVRDALIDPRWPLWAGKVAVLGVRSVLEVPLHSGDQTLGVLGLYCTVPDAFTTEDEAIAQMLSRHVAAATARRAENLTSAVDARKLIGQAMGILMERHDIDGDRAFAVLRQYSQDTDTKLRDVAQLLIDTRRLPSTARSGVGGRPMTEPAVQDCAEGRSQE